MADAGPLPVVLQKKKIAVEIRRLEHMIENQELEVEYLMLDINKKKENIEASRREIETQKGRMSALDKQTTAPTTPVEG